MAIVCGIDFSEPSLHAATAAAHLAARMKLPLHLVSTLEVAGAWAENEPWRELRSWGERRLRHRAEHLRELTCTVEIHLEVGPPDDVLMEVASRTSAKLIVIGPVGRRHGKATLGAHADRVAQRSHVPVIVLRDVAPFRSWVRESRPLRVVLGADSSQSSESAMQWIRELRTFGPCDVTAVELYWPPDQFHRLGLGGLRSYLDPDPQVVKTLEREFFQRMSALGIAEPIMFRSSPNLGRIADRLADIAKEERADLVVVGSHRRNAFTRLWEGSVSRRVLQCAQTSVACIPSPAGAQPRAVPRMGSVLVATDLSPLGDAAIPLAYATAAPGATVHLVHVLKAQTDPLKPHDVFREGISGQTEAVAAATRNLLARVPEDAAAQSKASQVHVLESTDAATAICQAAERLGVDMVCLGTHGRSGIAKGLLGSVAQEVLTRSHRPVVLTRTPTD